MNNEEINNYFYTIDEEAKNLSLVSLRLYGTQNKWKEIAKWNNLTNPNHISLGQKLIIKQKPILSTKDGNYLLYEYYLKRFNQFSNNFNQKKEFVELKTLERIKEDEKKFNPTKKTGISFVSKFLVSAAYSSSILNQGDPQNHLGSYGFGGLIGYNFKDIFTIGISSEFRFINQYSSVSKIGSNMKGTFWNYASLSLSKTIKMIDVNLDLHYFGKYSLSKKSAQGKEISYTNPLGYKLSMFYPLPILERKLKIGFGIEWITLKKISVDNEEFNSNRKLWQTGVILNYEF
jgi:hypothetical protein